MKPFIICIILFSNCFASEVPGFAEAEAEFAKKQMAFNLEHFKKCYLYIKKLDLTPIPEIKDPRNSEVNMKSSIDQWNILVRDATSDKVPTTYNEFYKYWQYVKSMGFFSFAYEKYKGKLPPFSIIDQPAQPAVKKERTKIKAVLADGTVIEF